LPTFLGLDEGVLVEPLAVAVHVCRLANIRLGEDVVVFGAGTIGLLCAAVSKAMGARNIICVDISKPRLEFAQRFAATGISQPMDRDTGEELARKIKSVHDLDAGADVVLEATGMEVCIAAGIHVLKKGGTFIQAGLGKPDVQFPIATLSEKEMVMKGSFRYGAGDYKMALHLLETRKVSVKELITCVVDFEKATEAWERTKKGEGIKNLIHGPQD
jgi:D-xylulose reductase